MKTISNKDLYKECENKLKDAFKQNARGAKRQKVLHGWITEKIETELGKNYTIYSKRDIDIQKEKEKVRKKSEKDIESKRHKIKELREERKKLIPKNTISKNREYDKLTKRIEKIKEEISKIACAKKDKICCLTCDGELIKEANLKGIFYEKNVDIAIKKSKNGKDENFIGIISIKFITSSYQKNAVNYIEQLFGEVVNLHEKEAVFGAIIFITDPPQTKSKQNKQKDGLNDRSVEKYIKMVDIRNNTSNKHNSARIATPNYLSIVVAALTSGNRNVARILDLKRLPKRNQKYLTQLNEESKVFLTQVNLRDFLTNFCNDITGNR